MKQALKHIALGILSVSALSACAKEDPQPVEYYDVAFRQLPPAPVYSRVMWSQLPHPVKPKVQNTAPLLLPVVDFEMPQTTLGEAVEALAQAMGYRWHYPSGASGRKIAIRMSGSVEEVLAEITRQAGVQGVMDHEKRIVMILDEEMVPRLPKKRS